MTRNDGVLPPHRPSDIVASMRTKTGVKSGFNLQQIQQTLHRVNETVTH